MLDSSVVMSVGSESIVPVFLLLEDGNFLLLEDAGFLQLES
jgi:hypothetical protein